MSDPAISPTAPMTGLNVLSKDDEDYSLGVVEDVDNETGNLIIRGNLDLRSYSVPQNRIVSIDQANGKIIFDMTQDDFINHEITSENSK